MRRMLMVAILSASCLFSQLAPDGSNPVKKKLQEGGVVIGGTIFAANIHTMSLMAEHFDFLWIDGEHGPMSLETISEMIVATRGLKAVPFTRVPVVEKWTAKQMMDMGSLGVIFPFTNTPELARLAVSACKYPPEGDRGSGPTYASARWRGVPGGYAQWANKNIMVIVIIERKEAVDNIEKIAAVPGIDVLFIGLSDLSYSLGVGGQTTAPVVKEAVAKVMAAAKKHNIPVGGPGMSLPVIKQMIADGYRFIQGPSDVSFINSGARTLLESLGMSGVQKKREEPKSIY